jgi:hypothetical protein
LPQDQPKVSLAKAVVRRNTAPIRKPWSKEDVRVLKSMTRKEPVAKNAKALKQTGGATPQKAIVIGLSPNSRPKSQSCRLLSQNAPSDVRAANASCWGERGYATHRTLGDIERPESFIPWPLAHLPRPTAFAPRQSSSLSREPPAGRAAYSTEHAFAQKVQPNTGLRHAHGGRTV